MKQTQLMLSKVARRIRFNRTLRWFSRCTIAVGVLYALLLLSAEIFGYSNIEFQWTMVFVVPAIGALLAILIQRPISLDIAAGVADAKAGTKDLFLTASRIANAPGEYKPLVVASAEAQAPKVNVAAVEPIAWNDSAIHCLCTVLVLLGGTVLLSNLDLDPFGVSEQRLALADKEKELENELLETKEKIREAKKSESLEKEFSPRTEAILNDLMKELDLMKPETMESNHKKLLEQQKKIANEYDRKLQEKLKRMENSEMSLQFGQFNPKAKKWKEELEGGSSSEMQEQLKETKELAKQLAEEKDPEKARELQKKIEKNLRELAEFAKQNAAGSEMQKSLERAMKQLQAAKTPGMKQQALEAMAASLEMSEMDLEELAQAMRDAQALEQAMEMLNDARTANAGGKMNKGKDKKKMDKLGEYQELYEAICKECGECAGCEGSGRIQGQKGYCPYCNGSGKASNSGMGGPGRGRGNIAPEDGTIDSDFKKEIAKSQLQAGKTLAEWDQKEIPDAGEATTIFKDAVANVRSQASEAITTEDIPPGYHGPIKGYFSGLEEILPEVTPNDGTE